jgi:hypothetical protein
MAKGFKHGAGGSNPLNFKIVSYVTEEELLAASPKENTVGVVTADTITSWIFSATEPTDPVEGMVWFSTSTTSHAAFNALKKNTLQVYPISAKQYIGGACVDVETKSFQNGVWVEWVKYLYNNGDECVSITGGWIDVKQSPTDSSLYYPVEKRNGSMYVKTVYQHPANFVTANAINLSGAKKIVVDTPVLNFTGSTFCDVTVSIVTTRNIIDSYVAREKVATSRDSIVVDVSGIQAGEYYVMMSVGYDVEIEITQIHME